MRRTTYYTVQASSVSLPDKRETWYELETFDNYKKAVANASNKNENGITVRGYHRYRIIKKVLDTVVMETVEGE